MKDAHKKICFALDVPTMGHAQDLIEELSPYVGAFKVGLELFMKGGPDVLRLLQRTRRLEDNKFAIILDLKLHDIPETVERAVSIGMSLGVDFMTLHVQQRATLERVAKRVAGTNTKLLGVTVLTSIQTSDFSDLHWRPQGRVADHIDLRDRVEHLSVLAIESGLQGLVCSPQEALGLRRLYPSAFLLVPGVRSAGVGHGDQKRVATPQEAVQAGADLIVVGRQIRDAESPKQAAMDIAKEISGE